jgi:hypothetical protein
MKRTREKDGQDDGNDARDPAASHTQPSTALSATAFDSRLIYVTNSAPADSSFSRRVLLGDIAMRETADGWLARMPTLASASLDELATYVKSLFDFLKVQGQGRRLMTTDQRYMRLVTLMESLREPMLLYFTKTSAIKQAEQNFTRVYVALTSTVTDAVSYVSRKTDEDTAPTVPKELQERAAASAQLLPGVLTAWVTASAAASTAENTAFHELLVETVVQIRALFMIEVSPAFRRVFFSDA